MAQAQYTKMGKDKAKSAKANKANRVVLPSNSSTLTEIPARLRGSALHTLPVYLPASVSTKLYCLVTEATG